jgi:hypothetical protein
VAVDLAGKVALEAAADLSEGASFGGSFLDVGACGGVHAHAGLPRPCAGRGSTGGRRRG